MTRFRSDSISYEVLDRLGEGLNSVVYRSIRSDSFQHLRQTVALKILKSKNLVDIWKNEFASLMGVHCQHCVRVFGFEWVDQRPALVLEYVDGVTLRQLMVAGPIATRVAVEILGQIQVGLNSLHGRGLCHGDLSPGNVMIDQTGCVKLLDFGGSSQRASMLQATPKFAAPELLRGGLPNRHSDLFSLGALEEMLLSVRSIRLNPIPLARQPFTERAAAKDQLAELVVHLTRHQKALMQLQTRSVLLPPPRHFRTATWVLVTVLLVAAPASASRSAWPPNLAVLRFRTHKWLRLSVNGEPAGFAPQEYLVVPGMNTVQWQSPTGSGRLNVSLAPNEFKAISDADL